jgi:hypothetical protein
MDAINVHTTWWSGRPDHIHRLDAAPVTSPFKAASVSAKPAIAGLAQTVKLEVAARGNTGNWISRDNVWTPLMENRIPDIMKARRLG